MNTTKKIIVTGAAGFIGSNLVRLLLQDETKQVISLDKLTYAGNIASLADCATNPRHTLEIADICDPAALKKIFETHQPDCVMHLAAESHVDRSIDGPGAFLETNIMGTYHLLQAALQHFRSLSPEKAADFRFLHVSTDEVFGSLDHDSEAFHENTPYSPHSPYSASKASSDHLVRSWHDTYGLPIVITNCSNNYGPYQFPEKLIPVVILKCLSGAPIPVYGKGENIRDWLYVEDHARALIVALEKGTIGETYVVGGNNERTNLEIVHKICEILNELAPATQPHENAITFVTDRPGHDFRYAINSEKIRQELGWTPVETFETGFRKTIQWYLDNQKWWQDILSGDYKLNRLGVI